MNTSDQVRKKLMAREQELEEEINRTDRDALEADYPECWIPLNNIWLRKNILWQRGLLPFLWRSRPKAVIFLGDSHFVSTWVSALLVRLRGGRVFMWTHGMLRREKGLKRAARLAFYSLAHGLLVYGHRAKNLLREAGYPEQRSGAALTCQTPGRPGAGERQQSRHADKA